MILISLVQVLTQPKCIQQALKAKDMEFIQEQGMLKVTIKLSVIKFSIDPVLIQMKQNVPGPGTYGQGIEINKYGSYILSTIENSKAATWSNSKNRFIDEQKHSKEIPGPGKYDPSDYNGSQYILSAYRSYGTRKYRKDSNVSKKQPDQYPGPGTYRAPSDFGYLELNKFKDQQIDKTSIGISPRLINTANSFNTISN